MFMKEIVYDSKYFPKCTFSQEREFFRILLSNKATKKEKMFFVGRMRFFGYCEKKILYIIRKYNRWEGYNENITNEQIHRLFVGLKAAKGFMNHSLAASILTDNEIIELFFKNCTPWFPSPSDSLKGTALYYCTQGCHVIPMRKTEKLPAVKWKEYQNFCPPLSMVSKWNFSHGLILLGTDQHTFLDIDMKSEKHPKGLEFFDESLLDGWYYERTPSGGYHVFGKGKMQNKNGNGVEIIGKGRYIVTYPTHGYVSMGAKA